MNTKKVAKLLLGLADSFDTNDPDTTNYRADTLRQIANEIEPQPEPEFKVGDWVEFKGKQYRISAIGGKGLFDDDNLIMFEGVIWCVSEKAEPRKLDPSEVIVKIGCLEGTVTYAISDDCFLLAKVYDPQHRACCIDMSMLDTATRELVESLLKAQEEK